MPETGRIFVVGCPRSGTTLLQSMLAAHPVVLGFPETHAFWGLESRNPLVGKAKLRSRVAAQRWQELAALEVPVSGSAPRTVGGYVRAVVAGFDAAARRSGKAAWSEKTPGHLRSVDLITAYAPDAHIVHVVREGVATVTSLYAVTQEHGEAWDGERSIELCLTRWRNDLHRTARHAANPRHSVLSYEALVGDPVGMLAALLRRLELPGGRSAAQAMADGYRDQAARVAGAGEIWKAGVTQELQDRSGAHAEQLTEPERHLIEAGVAQERAVYSALPFLPAELSG